MHIGNNNHHTTYTVNNSELFKVSHEKDLGMTGNKTFKPSKHCSDVVKTVNKLVGFIGRTFEYKSENVILTLFNPLVHPHLEYCIYFWLLYYKKKKNIDKLEIIEKLLKWSLDCETSLKRNDRRILTYSSKRSLRRNLIEVFKFFRGFDNIYINDYQITDLTPLFGIVFSLKWSLLILITSLTLHTMTQRLVTQ